MSNTQPSWIQSPIVVLPLAFFALGLAIVPFAIFNTDHAAQFYGAFAAAVVTAGAVIANSHYRDRLVFKNAERERRNHGIEQSLFLWSFLSRSEVQLGALIAVYQGLNYILASPPAQLPGDQTVLTVEMIRRVIDQKYVDRFDDATKAIAGMPKEIAAQSAFTIHTLEQRFSGVFRFTMIDSNAKASRSNVTGAITLAQDAFQLTKAVRSNIENYLRSHGYLA